MANLPETIAANVTHGHASDHQSIAYALNTCCNVRDYGAIGDGVTDDTDAINDAIAAAGAQGAVIFPGKNNGTRDYLVSDTIDINCHVLVLGRAKLRVNHNGIGVQLSSLPDGIMPVLPEIEKVTQTWTVGDDTSNSIGLKVLGASMNHVTCPRIRNFDIGFRLSGVSGASSHGNTFRFGQLFNNAIQFHAKSEPEEPAAACNANEILVGRMNFGTMDEGLSGTRFILIDDTSSNLYVGGNRMESNNAPELAVEIIDSGDHTIAFQRYEFPRGTYGQFRFDGSASAQNWILPGAGARLNEVEVINGATCTQIYSDIDGNPVTIHHDADGAGRYTLTGSDTHFGSAAAPRYPVVYSPDGTPWGLAVNDAGEISAVDLSG